MRSGKLTEEELKKAVSSFKIQNKEVVFGAGIGEDCAVIEPSTRLLITTDPITGEGANIEELILDINMNDIYAGGGEPIIAVMTVLAPENESGDNVVELIRRIGERAFSKGVDIVGGHTEFTNAVNRTVVSMTMLGRVNKPMVNSLKPGDKLIVTKYLGLEATQIMLNNRTLKAMITPEDLREFEVSCELSIGRESRAVRDLDCVHAMHDITEGGVFSACCELAGASELGVSVYLEQLPILHATKALCDYKGYNIGYIISSGSLLIATGDSDRTLESLNAANVKATVIGEVTGGENVVISGNGERKKISVQCDELFKIK